MDTIGVSQTDFLSGEISMTFDLEKARDAAKFDDHMAITMFPLAIAEIERLRADNAGLSKAVISIQEERDLAQAEFRAYHKAWEDQAAEIERMRGEMENYGDDYVCQMKSKDARIQELEDALVEMVATNPCNIPTLCDVVHDELMCLALDGNCDFWKGCPQKNELRKAARKQLQAEGEIGPDAKPRSWKITEERKAAIKELSELLTAIGCPSCHYYIQKNYGEDITVLRAMLTEAGQ